VTVNIDQSFDKTVIMELAVFCFLLGVNLIGVSIAEPVVVSGDHREIEMRRVLNGQVIKTIKIKEYDDIRLAVFYEQDVIFYASDKKVYMIELLDDNGLPTVSNKGLLLTDPLADHRETQIYEFQYNVWSIAIDKVRRKLIICEMSDIYEMDFDGTGLRKILTDGYRFNALQIIGNQLYFSDRIAAHWKSQYSIYRMTITPNKTISRTSSTPEFHQIVGGHKEDVISMMVEKFTKKLFFRRGTNSIRVVDTNLPAADYPVQSPRVVIADSQYVDGWGGIAVHGNRLVWNRKISSNGQLLLGLMNKDLNFLSKRNIYVYGKASYGYLPRQLDMFDHLFPTMAPAPLTTPQPTTLGQCMCPCACSAKANSYMKGAKKLQKVH